MTRRIARLVFAGYWIRDSEKQQRPPAGPGSAARPFGRRQPAGPPCLIVLITQFGVDTSHLPLLVEKYSIPPVRSGPVTACPAPSAGTCPAGDGAGRAPPGLSGYVACVGPPHPRVAPGRPPAPPSAPLSPGAVLRAPGLLGRSLRHGCWSAGRRAVSGKPFVPQNGVCVPNVSRGLSRPASALAVARAAVPRSPFPPSRCAAIARVGAPLPLPRARRIRSCGRVPLTSVPWLIRAAGQRPCGGVWPVAFRTEPGKL